MKHLIFRICFLLLISSQAFSQQTHFIYLQTENREPFYVLLNKKNYSSSAIGYTILPKLENGEYNIRIGFAKNAGAEQDYIIQVKDNEQGYLIKEFGEKGWALFNLQSMDLQYAGAVRNQRNSLADLQKAEAKAKEEEATAAIVAKRKADELAIAEAKEKSDAMLAEAKRKADEMSILSEKENTEKTAIETKRKEDELATAAEAKTKDALEATELKRKQDELAAAEVKVEKAKLTPLKDSLIQTEKIAIVKIAAEKKEISQEIGMPVLINQIKTDSGFIYRYAVSNQDGNDTVNAFIIGALPAIPATITPGKIPDTISNNAEARVKFLNMDFKQDNALADTAFIEPVFNKTNTEVVKIVTDTINTAVVVATPEKATITIPKWDNNVRIDSLTNKAVLSFVPNSNCKAQAEDKDFFSLRKKMASEEGADEMVMAARKTMKEKCFTTLQVRNLSVLFLNDADRYQFLDAAYPFTSDAHQYDKLMDLLYDNYYIQRFKAMIRKQ